MIEEISICPYTGLRPFTEDESIYFKGRDEHIDQATKQLQKNKFIMLTGASGDGKSSLVYAGILPNARAGFLKSQFSNWAVANFRPERNPLGNLSHALAKQFGIANENIVRTELSHGFSALVDMYKASSLFTDAAEDNWQSIDEKQRSSRKRAAANLIIVADQFEEFFTNPENFQKGVPSQEANLVTNVLLETARIALEENLPIYVIITMRSDFIGQCASFRGLPEAIGFSQFFVPRLNRAQLQEVIEEPAVLSGNKISRRLTERLIHDMVEGTDQLPILQHALNQVWKMADEGKAEMDLIHYAMVGGMEGKDLPDADAVLFTQWFKKLPAKIQACYDRPDLQNVLNTHANKLYTFASDYLKEQYGVEIKEEDARLMLESSFKCLTKIDNSRAVRNRMTLAEITAVINRPDLNFKMVGNVLNIFREPGNTLLRPFMEDVPELNEDSVLDITHESLIRNWEKLDQWAKEEFTSYTIFQDFSQQLNRWVDSGKSNSFLLYIGPLTYFENFFTKARPNAAWIARYLGEEISEKQQHAKATGILANANEFLQRSARKHIVTRTVMKYGAGKIAAILGLIAFITLSSFGVKTYLDRRNSSVLEDIHDHSIPLINNSKLVFGDRASLIEAQLRLKIMTIHEAIHSIHDPIEKLKIANGIAVDLITQGRTEPASQIAEALLITDSLFETYAIPFSEKKPVLAWLKIANDWRATLGLAYFYNSSDALMELQKRNAKRSGACVLHILEKQPGDFEDVLNLSLALENALNFNALTEDEIIRIIHTLSPFENNKRTEWVNNHFKKDQVLLRGYQGYGFNFNGLFQELACLYAANGNAAFAMQSIDTLLKYNESYYQRDYTNMLDNATNVASVFYRSHHAGLLDAFVSNYCTHKKMSEIEFYQRLLGRASPYQLTRNSHYVNFWEEAENLNLQYGEQKEIAFFYEKLRETLLKGNDSNEKNFLLAVSYKDEALTRAHHSEVVGKSYDHEIVNSLYKKSLEYYKLVDPAYLAQSIERVNLSGGDIISSARKVLFLYPDVIGSFNPLGARDYHWNYLSASFIDYLIDTHEFGELYQNTEDLKQIEEWLISYHYHVFGGAVFIRNHADPKVLAKLESVLGKINAGSKIDLNLLYLHLGYSAMEKNDQPLALIWYSKLKPENFSNIFREKLIPNYIQSVSLLLVAESFTSFVQNNKPENARKILEAFKNPVNRSSLYAFCARELVEKKMNGLHVGQLLDSAQAEMKRVENSNELQPNRPLIAVGLVASQPSSNSEKIARNIIKNQPLKYESLQRIARALSYNGQLFAASEVIPANISDEDQLSFLWNILQGYTERLKVASDWREYEKNIVFPVRTNHIPYVDETN
jgi:energy-coupling factor transporter ATP-binding protein EcfA2